MAINFPCGLRTVEQCLPNLSAFDKVIAASFESREDTAKLSHVIRRDVLVQALPWLCQNNKCHQDVTLLNLPDIKDHGLDHSASSVDVDSISDVFSMIPSDYALPDVSISDVLSSNLPHVQLLQITQALCFAYKIENGEEMVFPWLFPFGCNGFLQERKFTVTLSQYFQHRLYYHDGRFRKDIAYLLHALNY